MYNGWIAASRYFSTHRGTPIDRIPHVAHGAKTLEDLTEGNVPSLYNIGIVAPYYEWSDTLNSYGRTDYIAFKNTKFRCKFEVGSPRKTASSSEVTLYCP